MESIPTTTTVAPINPWGALAWWSLAMVVITYGLSWVLPPIVEGYWGHSPAVATIMGRFAQTTQRRESKTTIAYFHQITWTDDRGHVHKDALQIGWKSYAPGSQVKVHYALQPDGSTRMVWEQNLHPALGLIALIAVTVTGALSWGWLQALWRVFRAPSESAPTPGSDPNP